MIDKLFNTHVPICNNILYLIEKTLNLTCNIRGLIKPMSIKQFTTDMHSVLLYVLCCVYVNGVCKCVLPE